MKIVLVFSALAAIAAAAPTGELLQYDFKQLDDGQFSLSYQTSDGITVTRQGELQPNDEGDGYVLVQSGSESYTAPDGTPIRLVWNADKDGYHPKGDHLPAAPTTHVI